MNPTKLRRSLFAALIAAFLIAVPSEAQKRRAISPRSPGVQFTREVISGQILDNVTSQPVVGVTIAGGNRVDITDAQGRFDLKNVTGIGSITLIAERSGYQPYSSQYKATDPPTVSIRLVPTKTVTIRKTDGAVLDVDMESLKFGYPVPFSGYRDSESEDLCTVDGNKLYIHRSQIAKMIGPAAIVAGGACCTHGNAEKMTLTLKAGQTMDVIFTDTCDERYKVDVGARQHVSGQFVHVVLTDIAEIIFP
jgi:hypothetical protein